MRLRRHPATRLLAGDDGGLLAALDAGKDLHFGPEGLRATDGDGGRLFVASGGSTGAPKVIRRTVRSWITSFNVNADLFGTGRGATVATLGHIGHSLTAYALAEAAYLGAALLPLGGLRPDRQMAALRRHAATHLWATPTQLDLLARHGTAPDCRQLVVGGGALAAPVRDAAARAFPNAPLTTFYGASETSFIALDGDPYPGVETDIRDGLIWVRSPYLFDGYASGSDSAVHWDDQGFLSVGELGHTADGRLHVTGRASRLVNIADRLVSPEPAEALLAALALAPVAVIALHDPRRGARLVAVREGAADRDLDASLLAACRARLGAQSSPRRMVVIPALPLLASGKVDLPRLARDLGAAVA